MTKSESIQNLAKALSEFQGKCPAISLNKTVKVSTKSGGSYTFDYATFDHILSIIKPVMKLVGLSFTQLLEDQGTVTTVLLHESGEYISTTTKVSSQGSIQDLGGHYTYLKRYALCAALGIVGEEDDDANASIGNTSKEVLRDSHPKWNEIVKYLGDDGLWSKVEEKFIITPDIKSELEADIARYLDPTGHGLSASASQISKKVKQVAG